MIRERLGLLMSRVVKGSKGVTPRTVEAARLDQLDRDMAEIKALVRTGFDNMTSRMERISLVEGQAGRLQQDVDRAFEKMRTIDIERGATTQILAQLQASLSELPKIAAALNGDSGLITRMAVMQSRIDAQGAWGKAVIMLLGSELIGMVVWGVEKMAGKVFGVGG